MTSPDGVCRPFDAQAAGAVFSHGCSVVVLKRLADALADGDQIYAVVKGSALNNDGAGKVSMTAPSIDGQAEVIALAQALAERRRKASATSRRTAPARRWATRSKSRRWPRRFGADSPRRQFCALGSLKTNVGHLEAAVRRGGFHQGRAGAPARADSRDAALRNRQPRVAARRLSILRLRENHRMATRRGTAARGSQLVRCRRHECPRRARGSARSTPQPPAADPCNSCRSPPNRPPRSIRRRRDLAAHLEAQRTPSLADTGFTLQTGRQQFPHRRCVVAGTAAEAITALRADAKLTRRDDRRATPVAFLFPGQGSQYPRMGAQLYASGTGLSRRFRHGRRFVAARSRTRSAHRRFLRRCG